MRVLVFGGTKFMGPHVVRELVARGHEVHERGARARGEGAFRRRALRRPQQRRRLPQLRRRAAALRRRARPGAARRGCAAARGALPVRHKAAELGDWVRDHDKILVERALAGPRTTVLRMPAVYGPNDERRRFYDWIDAMLRGDEIIAIDEAKAEWRWTRGCAANCAGAIVHACRAPRRWSHFFFGGGG